MRRRYCKKKRSGSLIVLQRASVSDPNPILYLVEAPDSACGSGRAIKVTAKKKYGKIISLKT
jgi:hypothetical protein